MNTFSALAVQGKCEVSALAGYLGIQAEAVPQVGEWTVCVGEQVPEIEDCARKASAHIMLPTLFVTGVEGRTAFFGVCIMGFTVFRHAIGETGLIGVKEQHVQSKVIQEVLKVNDKDAVRMLVREQQADKVISCLQEILGVTFLK